MIKVYKADFGYKVKFYFRVKDQVDVHLDLSSCLVRVTTMRSLTRDRNDIFWG